LLEDARLRGVVTSITNLFDEYISRVSDLIDVPYFDGDCWPTYAEHYIQEMESKGMDPRARQPRNEAIKFAQTRRTSGSAVVGDSYGNRSGGPNGSKRQKRAKSAQGKSLKARSTSLILTDDDDMDVVSEMPASLFCPYPKPLDQVPLQSLITARIALENDRMKDDFIVVKMFYDCVQCCTAMDYPGALYWIPKAYSPDKDPHDYRKRRYAPPYCLCHDCYLSSYQDEYGMKPDFVEPPFPPPEWAEEYAAWQATQSSSSTASDTSSATTPPPHQHADDGDQAGGKLQFSPTDSPNAGAMDAGTGTTKRKSSGPGRKRKATGADMNDLDSVDSTIEVLEPGKMARLPNPYGLNPPVPLIEMKLEIAMIRPKTVDPDPLVESQIFNLREDFLSLCQGNKYQFDELRRAKHSSMMILYHLHNPESDAFVHTCNGCKNDITTARYTCLTCQDFDLCQNCNGKVKHAHPLEKVTSTSSSLSGKTDTDNPNAEKANQKSSNNLAYMQMLDHSTSCTNLNCPEPTCPRMKKLLEHAPSCNVRIAGGCTNCKRYWQILAFHARQCRHPAGTCKVPHCERIKGHIRQQANQMADRRMMALMQRSNQSPAPSGSEEQQSQGSSTSSEANPAAMTSTTSSGYMQPAANPVQPVAPPLPVRSLTSPRGKGGKGHRIIS